MRTSNLLFSNLLTVVFLISSLSVSADHPDDWGPHLGTELPSDITVETHKGRTVGLSDLSGEQGLAIAFVRSADWCPFCKRQIIDLNKNLTDFSDRGVNLVVLSYDSVDVLSTFVNKQDIQFTLVSDQGSKVIDAFGIRNEKHKEGSGGYGIPHPGIMVFDDSGKLVAKFAEEGYRKRPPVADVLAAIDKHLQ